MASYPASVRLFSTRRDVSDVIFAEHINTLQEELAAVQTFMGLLPHISTTPSATGTFVGVASIFSSLAARLANIETGIVADTHTQYVRPATLASYAQLAGATFTGEVRAVGVFDTGARVYSTANPPPAGQTLTLSDALPSVGTRAAGTSGAVSRGDHSHGPSSTKGFAMTIMGA